MEQYYSKALTLWGLLLWKGLNLSADRTTLLFVPNPFPSFVRKVPLLLVEQLRPFV